MSRDDIPSALSINASTTHPLGRSEFSKLRQQFWPVDTYTFEYDISRSCGSQQSIYPHRLIPYKRLDEQSNSMNGSV